MGRPFYSKFVWKDWLAKTLDLSPLEYCAYHRLLTYAATHSPDLCSLPVDDRRLRRITGLAGNQWAVAKKRVLQFFERHLGPTGIEMLVHPRLRSDAGAWFQLGEKQRRNVYHRYYQTDTNTEVRSQKHKKNLTNSSRGARRREIPGFAEWYDAYPKHVGRAAAARAYALAINRTDGKPPFALLEGAIAYAKSVQGKEPQFIAHPATWLNQDRWLDEPSANGFAQVDQLAGIRAKIRELSHEP